MTDKLERLEKMINDLSIAAATPTGFVARAKIEALTELLRESYKREVRLSLDGYR